MTLLSALQEATGLGQEKLGRRHFQWAASVLRSRGSELADRLSPAWSCGSVIEWVRMEEGNIAERWTKWFSGVAGRPAVVP
jgi:hypothetical protein